MFQAAHGVGNSDRAKSVSELRSVCSEGGYRHGPVSSRRTVKRFQPPHAARRGRALPLVRAAHPIGRGHYPADREAAARAVRGRALQHREAAQKAGQPTWPTQAENRCRACRDRANRSACVAWRSWPISRPRLAQEQQSARSRGWQRQSRRHRCPGGTAGRGARSASPRP